MDFFSGVFAWNIFFVANEVRKHLNIFFFFLKKKKLKKQFIPCEFELECFSSNENEEYNSTMSFLFSNFYKKKRKLTHKKNLVIANLPFWIGKIVSISSFCRLRTPAFLTKKSLRKSLAYRLQFFWVGDNSFHRFYCLGVKIGKTMNDIIIKKGLKKIFWRHFLVLLSEKKKDPFKKK